MRGFWQRFLVVLLCALPSWGEGSAAHLMRDLVTVREIDKRLNERMPVVFNHLSEGGYIVLPSARCGPDGSVSATYASIPPYTVYGVRLQYTDHLEVVGNYRIFDGVPDPVLTKFGFGDFSDKGANLKVVLWTPEESNYAIPGLAVGVQDFLGTKQFEGQYVVATHVVPKWNLEMSLGYSFGRIGGLYGGALWMPFRKRGNPYLQGLTLIAEFDPTNYEDPTKEPHPEGRVKNLPFNIGVQYRLWNSFDFAASYVRGDAIAFSAGGAFPLGTTKGLWTKSKEDPIYRRPVNQEPIGVRRPALAAMHDLASALGEQHIQLLEAWRSITKGGKPLLWLRVENQRYRHEQVVRERLSSTLAALLPSDIVEAEVVIDNAATPVQMYRFRGEMLRRFQEQRMGLYELSILSPMEDPKPPPKEGVLLYKESRGLLDWDIKPRTHNYFGSSSGKFKYSYGLSFILDGYVFEDYYYKFVLGKGFIDNLDSVQDTDRLNPSQIINVRTDAVNYHKNKDLILDRFYLQRSWHINNGWYARVAGGWFEQAYGGVAGEFLYYPHDSWWAVGVEGAVLLKRNYSGIGFTTKVRKLDPMFQPSYHDFYPHQFFLNLYYDIKPAKIQLTGTVGRFLARDFGGKLEAKRIFDSGFEVSFWVTRTTAKDFVNGERYHDKGFSVSLPLDILFENSSKRRWSYAISAWLRDNAAASATGRPLYGILREERR